MAPRRKDYYTGPLVAALLIAAAALTVFILATAKGIR